MSWKQALGMPREEKAPTANFLQFCKGEPLISQMGRDKEQQKPRIVSTCSVQPLSPPELH